MNKETKSPHQQIYDRIRDDYIIVCCVDIDQLFIYRDGIYIPLTRSKLLGIISEYNNSLLLSSNLYQIIKNMLEADKQVKLADFDANPNIINLKDGLYNFKGWKKPPENHPHFIYHYDRSQGGAYPYLSFIQLPVCYNPEAEGLIIDRFFEDVFGWQFVSDVYEMIAYFLMPTIKYQKAFLLYGAAGAGKSTFIDLIIKFIGIHNIEMINLKELYRQFRRANLQHALINIWDELESMKINKLDVFKILTTNEFMGGDQKYVQKDSKWINRTKQLYSTNFLPELPKDTGYEFFRRWIILYCNNDFLQNGKFDIDIKNKILTQSELSGLFNNVIKGWTRLEERKKFSENFDNIDKVIETWESDRNPVAKFVEEKCEQDDDFSVDKNLFKDAVNEYRQELGKDSISIHMCTISLKRLGISQREKRDSKRKRKDQYLGIRLKDNPNGLIEHILQERLDV